MVQWGTSLDMETINDTPFAGSGQENGPYYFVKKPDLPLNIDPTAPQHPHFQVDAPDVLSLDDIERLFEDAERLLDLTPEPKPPPTHSPAALKIKLRNSPPQIKTPKSKKKSKKPTRTQSARRLSRDERLIKIAKIFLAYNA